MTQPTNRFEKKIKMDFRRARRGFRLVATHESSTHESAGRQRFDGCERAATATHQLLIHRSFTGTFTDTKTGNFPNQLGAPVIPEASHHHPFHREHRTQPQHPHAASRRQKSPKRLE
jgi:hypothetical protein